MADTYQGKTIDELLGGIDASWTRLMETIAAASEGQKTEAADPQGWTVLDHMAHVTAWERSVLFPLRGWPRHEGLGVTDEQFAMDFDPLNEIVRSQTVGHSYEQVMADAQDGHQSIVEAIRAANIDDLWKPTTELCPDQREANQSRPFMEILMSDTAEHYDEHRSYIETIISA